MTTSPLPIRRRHRALLEVLHRELSTQIDEANTATAWLRRPAEGGGDVVDSGSRAAQRDQNIAVLASVQERRRQVEHCLQRIEDGKYGWCELCGDAIPPARLDVFPSATTCVDCQRQHERRS
jgi:DnaK suppressor protein